MGWRNFNSGNYQTNASYNTGKLTFAIAYILKHPSKDFCRFF